MARGLNMAFLAAIAIAALIQTSVAQTTHTVGDTTGWAIPTGDPAFYSSWAANQTFNVGEILVFNFMANAHDVAKVTKADYDACTTSSPISLVETSPARINLDASGEHYFICNFTGHCSAGQKMMINVSAASFSPSPAPQTSSPAPQPSTPTPQPSTPAPQPRTPTPQPSPAPQPSTPAPQPSTPAPQPSTPAPQPSTPAPQPSTPTPASGPSPPAPTPDSGSPPSPPTATTPAPAPASGSPPSPPTATPPSTGAPPNSARSLGFAGFTTFLSIFVVFLCY